jgi:hypothetical protein
MIQSMKVKVSTFTQQFTQTEINNLALGKNNQIHLTNTAMVNYLRNTNLSSLTPSIEVTPKYTTLNQQSSGDDDDDGITQTYTYTYGTGSCVLIDPGNGINLQNNSQRAYIYMGGMYATWLDIVNNILTNSFVTVNSLSIPSSDLTQNNSWLPNQYGSGPSYWYNCSLWTEDYVAQQIIVYAALYAYINTQILEQPVNTQMSLALQTNATGPMYSPPGPPYNIGTIIFSTAWPFQLNNLSIQTSSNEEPLQFNVPYNPNANSSGGNLPPGLSGLTTLDENDMLNLFQINLPIAFSSNYSFVGNYSSNPTNIVSLTPAGAEGVIVMNFTATGTTTVTINDVSFNVNIPSTPINFSSWLYPSGLNNGLFIPNGTDTPYFSSTEYVDPMGPPFGGPWPNYMYGQWNLYTRVPAFNPVLPTPIQNAIVASFTSSNYLLPVVSGQYVSVNEFSGNNNQTSTITATLSLFGNVFAGYSYTYTFTLPSTNPNPSGQGGSF